MSFHRPPIEPPNPSPSPNPSSSERPNRSSSGRAAIWRWGALLLVAVAVWLISLRYWIGTPAVAPENVAQQPGLMEPAKEAAASQAALERKRRQAFFQSVVTENLTAAQQANQDAADRCLARIEANFDRYRKNVDPFVDDVLGMGTRFGLLKRMPGGWWSGDDRVKQYIMQKFEQHLFSEKKLTDDLRLVLEEFRAEIQANQRSLLVKTQAAIDQSDLPPIKLDDYEVFFAAVTEEIGGMAQSEAETSVKDGLMSLVVSEAGSAVVGMLAGRLVTAIAASSTAAVATSGGATAGGAAAGAAGGSVVPGAGTIAGFVAGLVVGLGIDYWMTNQTAAKLETELLNYINQIEGDLLDGPASYENKQRDQGLKSGLQDACHRLDQGVYSRMQDIIIGETGT